MDPSSRFQPARRYPRVLISKRFVGGVEREGTMHLIFGRTLDLSEGGVGARVEPALRPGELVRLELPLYLLSDPVHAEAVVRYASDDRCGLEFRNLGARERSEIRRKVNGRRQLQ